MLFSEVNSKQKSSEWWNSKFKCLSPIFSSVSFKIWLSPSCNVIANKAATSCSYPSTPHAAELPLHVLTAKLHLHIWFTRPQRWSSIQKSGLDAQGGGKKTKPKHRGKHLTWRQLKGYILQWFLLVSTGLHFKTYRIASNTSGLVLIHKILINIPSLRCTSIVTSAIILKSVWFSSYFSASSLIPT